MYVYRNSDAAGYFFLMYFMYALASLPFVYAYSFVPKSSVMGLAIFFIVNVTACVIDAVLNSFTIFIQNTSPSSGPLRSYYIITAIRTIIAIFLPTVNLKQALFNIQLHENTECISVSNSIIGTRFSPNESYMSLKRPGVGSQFIIFIGQFIFWWVIIAIIERWEVTHHHRDGCCSCFSCCDYFKTHTSESVECQNWDTSVCTFFFLF